MTSVLSGSSSSGGRSGNSQVSEQDFAWLERTVVSFMRDVEEKKTQRLAPDEFVKVHLKVYQLTGQGGCGKRLYDTYSRLIEQYVKSYALKKMQAAVKIYNSQGARCDYLALLRVFVGVFRQHATVVEHVGDMFDFVQRTYVDTAPQLTRLKTLGYVWFDSEIFKKYHKVLNVCIFKAVHTHLWHGIRLFSKCPVAKSDPLHTQGAEYDSKSQGEVQAVINAYLSLGAKVKGEKNQTDLYKENIEEHFFTMLKEVFSRLAAFTLEEERGDLGRYLHVCEYSCRLVKIIINAYLHPMSTLPVFTLLYRVLLADNMQNVFAGKAMDNVLDAYMANEKSGARDVLRRMHRLYHKFPDEMRVIGQHYRRYVSAQGQVILERGADSGEKKGEKSDAAGAMIKEILTLHATHQRLVDEVFQSDSILRAALSQAFTDFINKDDRVSHVLARHVHQLLTRMPITKQSGNESKALTDSTVDPMFASVVSLYTYITHKDVFELQYQQYLAWRLLYDEVCQPRVEDYLISKFRSECGYQWTSKLEGMFKDARHSKSMSNAFRKRNTTGTAFEINVCSAGFWPEPASSEINVPTDLVPLVTGFTRFYSQQHPGHKLRFNYGLGRAVVEVDFSPDVRKQLVCSTYQMLILLQFKHSTRPISYKDLLKASGLKDEEVGNHLLSLCHPSVKVLLKKPYTRDLKPDHLFMINGRYTNPRAKISIPLLSSAGTAKAKLLSDKEQDSTLRQNRVNLIDSCAIRLLKLKKTARHRELISDMLKELRPKFEPDVTVLKRRIESLIHRDFIRRDDKDRDVYHYVA